MICVGTQSRLGKENFRWSYDFMPLRREGTAARGWQLLDSGEGRMGNPPTVRGLASADRARLHSRRARQLVGPDGPSVRIPSAPPSSPGKPARFPGR
jgi:hypothetical protein